MPVPCSCVKAVEMEPERLEEKIARSSDWVILYDGESKAEAVSWRGCVCVEDEVK